MAYANRLIEWYRASTSNVHERGGSRRHGLLKPGNLAEFYPASLPDRY